ncbi:hypothetical protein ACFQGT_07900 [Natrialbaceae archaeon GCM10025810]|uniref:hypothetical protein n=1 Tax=Halovalidus salilacus TaxID=3075124 RepID=UPI003617D1AF
MTEQVDPRDLPTGFTPAVLELRDDLVYVADVSLHDSGWLEFVEWTGERGLLPPHQCGRVKFVPTEVDEQMRRRVGIDDLRSRALPKREVVR